jgi:phenylacetate-CoA ligase
MNASLVGKVLFPLHERLKGKTTFEWLRRLSVSQWWPSERLLEYQSTRLRTLLRFAYVHTPYYREAFDQYGVRLATVRGVADLHRLPMTTRDVLRERFDDLRARPYDRGVQRLTTGGSTGAPVAFLADGLRNGFDEGARLRGHGWFGVPPGAREVVLWGSPIDGGAQGPLKSLRDQLLNSRLLSAFDMSEAALAGYAREIARYRPQKMFGYASALYLLAQYCEAVRWQRPRGLKATFATAEPLFDFQRKTIESAFQCAVGVEYGARDAGLLATQCPDGGLHVPAEGIVVEIAGPDLDGVGEIVVTNLQSFAFPIIRYRTGDLGRLETGSCSCGRHLPRLRGVVGRRTDFVVLPDGRCLHALAIIYPLRDTPRLREFRVTQEAVDRVVVQIVVDAHFSADDAADLRARLAIVLGGAVTIVIERLAAIPALPSGKFRYVISRVAEQRLDAMLSRAGAGS